jgi:hypothetical protein
MPSASSAADNMIVWVLISAVAELVITCQLRKHHHCLLTAPGIGDTTDKFVVSVSPQRARGDAQTDANGTGRL